MGTREEFPWPEQIKFWTRFSKKFRVAFLSAVLIGVFTHLYALTNILLTHDAVGGAFTVNAHLDSGRWSLSLLSAFSLFDQMPVVIGFISIVMIALTAGITVRALEISSPIAIILASGLLVVFPPVAATFGYMYTADAYFIALFMNALAAYLTIRRRRGWICAVPLLAVALGIYQSYIAYAAGLLLMDCILAFYENKPVKATFTRMGKYFLILCGSIAVYCIIEALLLFAFGKTLLTYQGMDSIGRLDFLSRLSAIPRAYRIFVGFFLGFWNRISFSFPFPFIYKLYVVVLSSLMFLGVLLGCFSAIFLIIRRKICRNLYRLGGIITGCLLIPLALNCTAVLAYRAYIYVLMEYSFVLLPIFILKISELSVQDMIRGGVEKKRWIPIYHGISAFFALLCWYYILISNVQYHCLQLTYENSFALANRIVARIEILEDYRHQPIAFIGRTSDEWYGHAEYFQSYPKLILNFPPLVNEYSYDVFISNYIGSIMERVDDAQLAELEKSPEVLAMPVYPAPGSVAIVDGVVAVKLGDVP